MVKVAIGQAETHIKTLENALESLAPLQDLVPEKANVLILIDCLIPEGYPSTINQEALGRLIELLKTRNPAKIAVAPATMTGIDQVATLRFLGLDDFLVSIGAEPFLFEKLEDITGSLTSFTYFILYSQVKTHPLWNLTTAAQLIAYLTPYKNRWDISPSESGKGRKKETPIPSMKDRWVQAAFKIFDIKAPDLIINDAYSILEGNGPFLQKDTAMRKSGIILASKELFACDYALLKLFGQKPDTDKFNQMATQRSFPGTLQSELELTNPDLLKKTFPIILPETDYKKLALPGMKLYIGELSDEMKNNFLQFLYYCRTFLLKDIKNLKTWHIIVGNIDPTKVPVMGKIVIFGSDAIKSTIEASFRLKISDPNLGAKPALDLPFGISFGSSVYYPPEQLQVQIFKQQNKVRDEINKINIDFQNLMAQVSMKDDPLEREETQIAEEKKLITRENNMWFKQKKKAVKFVMNNERNKYLNKIPTMQLNSDILELADPLTYNFNFLIPFYSFWKPFEVPMTALMVQYTTAYYTHPKYDPKKIVADWKAREKKLQNNLIKKFKPLKAEVDKALKAIKIQQAKELKKVTQEYQETNKKIAQEFHPRELELKRKLKEASRIREAELRKKTEEEKVAEGVVSEATTATTPEVAVSVSPIKSSEATSAEIKSEGIKAAKFTAAEVKPAESKSTEVKIAEVKPAEIKPAEVKPAEVKPQEVKAPEVKPAEVKPAEVKPAEVKPQEVKAPEVKPAEVKPVEVKPIEKSAELKAIETSLNQTLTIDIKPLDIKIADAKIPELKLADIKPADVKPTENKKDEKPKDDKPKQEDKK